ncbi:MAG: hypothetical protein U9N62_06840 [Thermotogota bacterium]|nr:hypothetical protein [Thermotogota bacterium]
MHLPARCVSETKWEKIEPIPSQYAIIEKTKWYVEPDGKLNMQKLLTNFQQFFREHSESWLSRFKYEEAGPQLLLQAFLQRIINGGGGIDRQVSSLQP